MNGSLTKFTSMLHEVVLSVFSFLRFSLIAAAMMMISACGPIAQETETPSLPPTEYFMTYLLNGKRVTLNQAATKERKADVRYTIDGASNAKPGDPNVIVIQHNDGPPRMGTFTTAEKNVIFKLGQEGEESSMTLDLATQNYGAGEFTISEITETYAKGSFQFTALDSVEGSKRAFIVTDGLFKVKRREF